jgi:hypothetical protein
VLTVPPGRELVLIVTGGVTTGATAMLRLAVAVFAGALESATRTVKGTVPDAVGVPLITPELLRFNPAGKEPADSDQL